MATSSPSVSPISKPPRDSIFFTVLHYYYIPSNLPRVVKYGRSKRMIRSTQIINEGLDSSTVPSYSLSNLFPSISLKFANALTLTIILSSNSKVQKLFRHIYD